MSRPDSERCKTCLAWPEEHNEWQTEHCRTRLDKVTINANGSVFVESMGWRALALGAHIYDPFALDKVNAHMNYIQRVQGDWSGALKLELFTRLATAATDPIRFTLCGRPVIEDSTMPADVVEFRTIAPHEGIVMARIVNLCTKLPGMPE